VRSCSLKATQAGLAEVGRWAMGDGEDKSAKTHDDAAAAIPFCRAGLAWLAPSDGATIGRTVGVSASLRHGVCVFALINHATL
jgi:hypothetical protein